MRALCPAFFARRKVLKAKGISLSVSVGDGTATERRVLRSHNQYREVSHSPYASWHSTVFGGAHFSATFAKQQLQGWKLKRQFSKPRRFGPKYVPVYSGFVQPVTVNRIAHPTLWPWWRYYWKTAINSVLRQVGHRVLKITAIKLSLTTIKLNNTYKKYNSAIEGHNLIWKHPK